VFLCVVWPVAESVQDSLGGDAKTLMFVNISPSAYNEQETLNSLMYGARAKLIQNDATRNVENKIAAQLKASIAVLKSQIERLKRGEVRLSQRFCFRSR